MEGVGTQAIAQTYGLSRSVVESHRTAGHAGRAVTKAVLTAQDGPLSTFASIVIANKVNRVRKLDDLVTKIEQVMQARAEKYKDLPGGSTGLIAVRQRMIGSGENATIIDEPHFDKDVVSEYRAVLEQAAKEAGEWKPDGGEKADAQLKLAQSIIIHAATSMHTLDQNVKTINIKPDVIDSK